MKNLTLILAAAVVLGCGDVSAPDVSRVLVSPDAELVVEVGASVAFSAAVWDSSGRAVPSSGISWSSADSAVASVSAGGLATARAAGVARIVAEFGGMADTATLEVWLAPKVASYQAGTSYFGRNEYVEYIPGTLPVVVSAPHGGELTPDEIPDRTWGTLVTDAFTVETVLAVRDAIVERTGAAPHLVISHLKRTKLDPNREVLEAAQESPFAENAWAEFQSFIDVASQRVEADFEVGLYMDVHGHGHPIDRVEIGYLLSSSDLNQDDDSLDGAALAAKSSIAALAASSPLPFSRLVRGSTSFGAYLGEQGVRSVPSPAEPSPGSASYFTGGYNTVRHGSRDGGAVSGIQLELYRPGLRDSDAARRAFAARLAWAVEQYMREHYGLDLGG